MTTAPFPEAAQPGRFWRWLTTLTIIGAIALNYYANSRPFNGQTMGDVSAKYPTLLTPAGYAFSIWGLIFLSLLFYAVWQLLPAQRNLALPDMIARPLALATAATGAWVVVFAHEQIGLSVLLMLTILGALALVYGRARARVRAGAAPYWVSIPFALFLGWITVATVINVIISLRELTGPVDAELEQYLAYALLLLLSGLVLFLSASFQERTFPVVLAWALVGIWLAHVRELPVLGWTALGAAALVLLVGLILAQQGRKLHPHEIAQAAMTRTKLQQERSQNSHKSVSVGQ